MLGFKLQIEMQPLCIDFPLEVFYLFLCFSLMILGIQTLFSNPFGFYALQKKTCLCPEATVTLVPVWKRGVSKRGILKSLVSHVLNFKSWIKLIYDKITYIYCVINEFNPTFEVQKMGKPRLFKMPGLATLRSQKRHFEKPCFPFFELQKVD